MGETSNSKTTKKALTARARVLTGRPPLERAGEVDERILDAAAKVFLERGFDGASIELIAETARSGKPTIYSRFPNKEALFAAACEYRITAKNARLRSQRPAGATLEERLINIGAAIIRETLTEELIGLFRLAIAETHRFPELVASVSRMGRQRGVETVARLLAEVAEGGEFPGFRAQNLDTCPVAARIFSDLILLPLLMRALQGESLATLHAEIDAHVARRIAFFLAAVRNGGLA
jgi:AcrR family transcriptional regulator